MLLSSSGMEAVYWRVLIQPCILATTREMSKRTKIIMVAELPMACDIICPGVISRKGYEHYQRLGY